MGIRNAALAFSFGVVASHWLPDAQSLWGCCVGAGAGILLAKRARLLGAALIGLGWGAWHALDAMDRRIDPDCREATVIGRVAGLPWESADEPYAQRLVVVPHSGSCEMRGALRLGWIDGPKVGGGEWWSLKVRLRPPRGTANAHGFDADAWSAREGVAAVGYVLEGTRLDTVDFVQGPAGVSAFRQVLRHRLARSNLVHEGVVAALTLGDKAAIPPDKVDLYRRTGTMHLLVISGLHVGIVTGFGFLVGRGLASMTTLAPRLVAVATALAFAGAYVTLAGGGLSLLRAFAMSVAGMVAMVGGRTSAPSAVFAYALVAVLLVDPMAPLDTGFWLSFGAVAVLLGFFVPRPRPLSWLRSAVHAQLAIASVFVPATTGITGLVHPLGIAVNLVAVPAVTILVVPTALAGVALIATPIGGWLLTAADFLIQLVEEVLSRADRVAPIYTADQGGWTVWMVVTAALGLLPVSRSARVLVIATVAMLILWPRETLPPGHVELTALDVGQGTAVLVETANHTLVYDTGPMFLSGRDMGTGVVLPAARGRGWKRLDRLILSHGDLDHVGGGASVVAALTVGQVLAGERVPGVQADPCHAGTAWRWDGVLFTVLHPPAGAGLEGNNASCVLLIDTGRARALLAGDIEAVVENRLRPPSVDLLLVPHHGSATSSTAAFVAATSPRFAIIGAGFENRFGHPHAAVVSRYRNSASHIASTAEAGAIVWRSTEPGTVQVQRCTASPYWRKDPSRARDAAVECRWYALPAAIELPPRWTH